ncbi:M20/M25/M40 family metallo-hydrolase, partial [candidate division WOR-3 bacterium]|nr:M20/M25/M40 family metallo-hydrolase [candidate division WOR-3 bacterium]MBD3364899.1 M20/M25/M40 family metallo-hydrolase [candidate division WOR-3 bacterium]
LVPVGSLCVWDTKPVMLQGTRVAGPGLDNKVGVFLALLLTSELMDRQIPGRLRFHATTQEEGVMFGAGYAGRSVSAPEEDVRFAMVADATFGSDSSQDDGTFELGKGPVLGKGPILSRLHLEYLRGLASRLGIDYTLEPLVRSTGTEADVLSVSGQGIPAVLVSIPLRYMHSPVEVVDLDDVDTCLKLISKALQDGDLWSF